MSKYIRFIIGLLIAVGTPGINAQNTQYISAKESDPEATRIIDDIHKKYAGFETIEIDFELEIDLPEKDAQYQRGKMIQSGEKYMVDFPQRAVFCDGDAVYLYLKRNNEVQINDIDEDDPSMMVSPLDMLDIVKGGDFVYAVTGSLRKDGKKWTKIEFKPISDEEEYFKISLLADAKKKDIGMIKFFMRDGSRYTLTVKNMRPNVAVSPDTFTFDTSKYPGVHVEDLRID